MGSRNNYFKLGLFVLATVALVVAGIIVLSAGVLKKEQVLLETYITESVQGLSVGSPVKRSGVKIGTVKEISFVSRKYPGPSEAPRYSNWVLVVMSIDQSNFPSMTQAARRTRVARQVEQGLRIKMATQGITGIGYLEAEIVKDPGRHELDKITWEPEHLYIPSRTSTITSFTESLDGILVKLEQVDLVAMSAEVQKAVESLRTAIDDLKVGEMRKEFVGLMAELKLTSRLVRGVIDKSQGDFDDKTKADVAGVLASLDKAAKSIQELVKKSQAELKTANIPKTIARFDRTAKRLEQLAAGQQGDIDAVMANLRLLSENLMKLSESAKQYPSQVLFGSAPPRKEKEDE